MARVEIASMPWGVVQDRAGNAVLGASVTLKNLDGSPATHWSAATGGTSTTAAIASDINGTLTGRFIEGGQYLWSCPSVSVTDRRVDAVSGSVESESASTTARATVLESGHEFDILARSRGGLDLGQAGVQAPIGHAPQTTPVSLVAGTEYSCRAFVPRTMKFSGISFMVRTAAGASDTVHATLRDSAGNILATGSGTPGVNAAGRKTQAFTTPVVVEAGEIVYASILIPTFGGTAVGLWVSNATTSAGYQLFGGSLGQVDALAKTGLSSPASTLSASDTTTFAPILTINDAWGFPLRAWSNPNLTSIAPFTQFGGLSQGSQLSYVTDTVRVPGTRAARCLVRPGDVQPATSSNGERCECVEFPGLETLEDTFWYAWSTFLPSDFTVPTTGITGGFHWAIIAQWHAGFSISPPIGIDVRTDGLYCNLTTGEVSVSGLTTNNVEAVKLTTGVTLGVWHDFVMRATWSMTGALDLFHREASEQRFSRVLKRRAYPTTQKANGAADSAAAGVSTHIGFYRSAEPSLQNVVYQQGLRRGRALNEVVGIFGDPVTFS